MPTKGRGEPTDCLCLGEWPAKEPTKGLQRQHDCPRSYALGRAAENCNGDCNFRLSVSRRAAKGTHEENLYQIILVCPRRDAGNTLCG